MSTVVKLRWTKYKDFFLLYEHMGSIQYLLYVIGATRLVYVGCVGPSDEKKGLRARYDKPYVERAKSIFGRRSPNQQPVFAAEFILPAEPSRSVMLNAERMIQRAYSHAFPKQRLMLTITGEVTLMTLKNLGDRPPFLGASVDATILP
jgi:hypothetical protein